MQYLSAVFFMGAGCLCFLYYIIIVIDSGFFATFSRFWLVLGAGLLALSALAYNMELYGFVLPASICVPFAVVLAVGGMLFLFVEFLLISAAADKAKDGGDYVIVLGAQVRGSVPSRLLRKRIETAVKYLKRNPQAKVIGSGGQGTGEDISEARCIKNVLVELGIDSRRILLEDKSTNTYENIRNSLELCGKDKKIVIVTCGYHMYRARALARAAGASQAYGYASPEDPVLMVNYYVREFFALVKYKLSRQI